MANLPDPNSVVEYAEKWQRFCDKFGDIVYKVLLFPENECLFKQGTIEYRIYQKALEQGNIILERCFLEEDKFIEELKENPKI